MFVFPNIPIPFFPHPLVTDNDGIVAVGGDLSVDTLLHAYKLGIFPWYNEEPILWWFTHPRCILYPAKVKIRKSMRPLINNKSIEVKFDTDFKTIISHCQNVKRQNQDGTWITDDIIEAYTELYKLGFAHSIGVYKDKELIGGLYGVAIGTIFFGESMFAFESNASKLALIHLCNYLEKTGFTLIDCQQETAHLMSMGAELVDKASFWNEIKANFLKPDNNKSWSGSKSSLI